jgi:hypothetical protein
MISPSNLLTGASATALKDALAVVEAAAKGNVAGVAKALGKAVPSIVDAVRSPALAAAKKPAKAAQPKTAAAKAGYAKTAKTVTATKASAKDPLAFLKDPSLSIEDKLARLLSYLNDKWDKEMQQKLEQIQALEGDAKASSSSKKSGLGGFLGAAKKIASAALGPLAGQIVDALQHPEFRAMLKSLSGPVLAAGATALGFPAAAPLLLQHGPAVLDTVTSALDDAEAKPAAAKDDRSKDSQRQILMFDIQRMYEKQKEMFSLVSNITRSAHDTRMSLIQNIR